MAEAFPHPVGPRTHSEFLHSTWSRTFLWYYGAQWVTSLVISTCCPWQQRYIGRWHLSWSHAVSWCVDLTGERERLKVWVETRGGRRSQRETEEQWLSCRAGGCVSTANDEQSHPLLPCGRGSHGRQLAPFQMHPSVNVSCWLTVTAPPTGCTDLNWCVCVCVI